MITVEKFTQIASAIAIKQSLKGFKTPSSEEQSMNLLKDLAGTWLVAVLPTLIVKGDNADSPIMKNETIFYVVEKEKDGSSHAKQMDQYSNTQKHCQSIIEDLLGTNEDGCKTYPNIIPSSIVVDPMYNIFGGWLGWRIVVVF